MNDRIDIEGIVSLFSDFGPAIGDKWFAYELSQDRLYLSRGPDGAPAIIVKGDEASFGVLPVVPGMEHSSAVTSYPTGAQFAALRICVSSALHQPVRLAAHIAYELSAALISEPSTSNTNLIARVEWVLRLLGPQETGLSIEKQRGLAGECILLRELLLKAWSLGLDVSSVLGKWWGYLPAHRDFAALGFGIEAKATSRTARLHHIGSLHQLDPLMPGEQCFLFSVGLRTDPTAPRKLNHIVDDVFEALVQLDGSPHLPARERLRTQLASYGYTDADRSVYARSHGFMAPHLPPVLFRESDLDRIRRTSFVDSELPGMVIDVSYELNVTAEPVVELERQRILELFLRAPSMTSDQTAIAVQVVPEVKN